MTRRWVTTSALVLIVPLGACGGEDDNPEARTDARRAGIEQKVRDGALPPIARVLISPDGAMDMDFIDGPEFANDVVRSSADGKTGPKLQWDLDQNGRIDREERTITEQELYAATAGAN